MQPWKSFMANLESQDFFKIGIVSSTIPQPLKNLTPSIGRKCSVHCFDINQHFQVLISDHKIVDCVIFHLDQYFFEDQNTGSINLNKLNELKALLEKFNECNKLLILNTIKFDYLRFDASTYFKEKFKGDKINRTLIKISLNSNNFSIIDLEQVISKVGLKNALNKKNGYVMKMPYTNHLIPLILGEYNSAIEERLGQRKKLVIVDADNTLWHGIIGEDSLEEILVNEEYPGIVYLNFQKQLLSLKKAGIMLALVTKNNEVDIKKFF